MNEEYSIVDALVELRPGAQWTIEKRDYNRLVWDSTDTEKGINVGVNTTPPTLDELNTKLTAMNTAEPMRLLRVERDQLLNESDWTQTRDNIRLNDSAWKTYRQALRDITATITDDAVRQAMADDRFHSSWPTKPS